MKIPFSPPDIGEEEISEVADTLRSGWITTGPKTKKFEKEIAEFCGTTKAVCLNSATASLEMTLRILGIGEDDEVIVPAYTYTASASVICHVGAKPVIVDCAKGKLHLDAEALANAITDKQRWLYLLMSVELCAIMTAFLRCLKLRNLCLSLK